MATTNNLSLPLLEEGQAQKEATINTAFEALDAAGVSYTGQTTSATPVNLTIPTAAFANDSTYGFDVTVVARNTATDTESKMWTVKFLFRRGAAAANSAVVGSPSVTADFTDTGTAGWTLAVTADTANGKPQIAVTGEAAKTISWKAQGRVTKVTG